MPFTLSHMVLAPPIAALSGRHLPLAAIAIGCMSPDLYRLFSTADFDFSHQWSSIYTFNLIIGLFFSALWYLLYRPFIYTQLQLHDPLWLSGNGAMLRFVVKCSVAVMLGSVTHIVWDGLTHSDFRSFIFQDLLARNVELWNYTYPVHRILQVASSVLTFPIIIFLLLRYMRQHTVCRERSRRFGYYFYAVSLFSLCHASFAYLSFAHYLRSEGIMLELYAYLGYSSNQFAQAFLISFTVGCLLYQILNHYDFFHHSSLN